MYDEGEMPPAVSDVNQGELVFFTESRPADTLQQDAGVVWKKGNITYLFILFV